MPDMRYAVWDLNGVPDLPREKQIEVLTRLQMRVHELFDALTTAEFFIEKHLNYDSEMASIYRALGRAAPSQGEVVGGTNDLP